ncbi:MAG: hypothetical protein ABI123_03300 [Ginsengibacter sp.]
MKNSKSIILVCSLAFMFSCSKQPYWNIPTDANGNAVITDIATASSNGISTLDDNFTVNTTLPNAKAGDVMQVELLKQQIPPGGGTSTQLLPLSGTQQTVTVSNDLTVSITYTRAQAQLNEPGDNVYVSFAGKTESASIVIQMNRATSVSTPQVNGTSVNVIRGAGTAWFNLKVQPKSGAYTGNVIVKKRNGMNDAWMDVGNFMAMDKVPVSGDDFAVGKDTMYYSFISKMGAYTDTVSMTVVDNDPYFFLKKVGTLTLGGSSAGVNLLINGALPASDVNAIVAIDGNSLTIHGGSAWAVGGKSISFVTSSLALYNQNNPATSMAAFMSGTSTATADPATGDGVYIFKIINGPNPSDVYYGMLKATTIIPAVSIGYEYKIGNTYNQLPFIK